MDVDQARKLIRGDRIIVVQQAIEALRRRLWSRRARCDLRTVEVVSEACEARIVELESEAELRRRVFDEIRQQRDDLSERLRVATEDLTKSERLVSSLTRGLADQQREQEGQRSAFLSQIDDLEARLADNLAAKVKLQAEVERTRQAQGAISAFISDLTDALAAKQSPRKRRS